MASSTASGQRLSAIYLVLPRPRPCSFPGASTLRFKHLIFKEH